MTRIKLKMGIAALAALGAACAAAASIVEQTVRSKAAGVDVIVYPMGVKDIVTVVGSLPAGDSYAAQGNIAAATLVGMLLDKGTTKQDKFAIAQQLDDVGAQLSFDVGAQTMSVRARFLKKDLPLVMRLMAEQMRTPAFSNEEFAKAKTQFEASVRQAQQNVNYRAGEAFSRAAYPVGHPNRHYELNEWLAATDKLSVDDLKAFHKKYYGPAYFNLIFVGDVNAKQIQKEVSKAFAGWSGGVDVVRTAQGSALQAPSEQTIRLADKTSVAVLLGQPTGLRYADADSLALRVGTSILGSDFTSRLMSAVRDKEGLTYGIRAGMADDTFVDGSWSISAAFSPKLVDRGLISTRRELDKWWQGGVTAAELEARKTNIVGSYQVSLATTGGMAGAMLQTLNRGKSLAWLDEYPNAIKALTVEQVNAAIKKHLDPQKMILIEAGTL